MKECTGNILDFINRVDAVCVTTNAMIKNNGEAVMGAGCAKSFADMYPTLPKALALSIQLYGNVTAIISNPNAVKAVIISVPTKRDWKDNSSIKLIRKSLTRLVEITNENQYNYVMLVRPGCSNGGLDWDNEVKPLCEELLDDRFYIIH